MILVIDNYDSFTWNLVHYLEEAGAKTRVIRNDAMTAGEALGLEPDGLVLSPGPCTPDEAGICMDLVRQAPADLPILGVCLGHQSIGQALGGAVITAREIRHGKRSSLRHEGGPLFAGLPERFDVVRYHSLAVHVEDLPGSLVADAFTDDGEIMAVRHVSRPVYGVQFHPESLLTEHGHALLGNWLGQGR
ncbi:MAG: aminodeoxychorismate/anthranilate synthase component II [Alphaproteobacteria bacterium]|jgi:anthranilate synthase component 2|nr:aminodeoxychorismate/anthranilate synthase component II [Alphaproteobacteria bacterium]